MAISVCSIKFRPNTEQETVMKLFALRYDLHEVKLWCSRVKVQVGINVGVAILVELRGTTL